MATYSQWRSNLKENLIIVNDNMDFFVVTRSNGKPLHILQSRFHYTK